MSRSLLQSGERIHLVDKKGRQYALTLKAGDLYQLSGHKIPHDELIGKADGSLVVLSGGKAMLAIRPTFGDYVLKMPRGAGAVPEGSCAHSYVGGCVPWRASIRSRYRIGRAHYGASARGRGARLGR